MTRDELHRLLKDAQWFSQIGGRAATIRSLTDNAESWDWLPTAQDQSDPIHGDELKALAASIGVAELRAREEADAARMALQSLRSSPDGLSAFADGPHDLTPAAKGGAVYAARMAAREIVVGRPGFWCDVIRRFHDGYWPCGLDTAKHLVVY
jgi:hypothetical protein